MSVGKYEEFDIDLRLSGAGGGPGKEAVDLSIVESPSCDPQICPSANPAFCFPTEEGCPSENQSPCPSDDIPTCIQPPVTVDEFTCNQTDLCQSEGIPCETIDPGPVVEPPQPENG